MKPLTAFALGATAPLIAGLACGGAVVAAHYLTLALDIILRREP